MKKKIIWILIAILIVTIGYLASLSDPPEDESIRFVDINSYISKEEMFIDIDSLTSTFEKIHPNPYRFFPKNHHQSKVDSIKLQLLDSLTIINFWRIIDQIIISYNDAHSNSIDSYILTDYVKKGKQFFPLSARIVDNKILVSGIENQEQVLPKNTEIIKINGKASDELIRDLLNHATRETQSLKLLEISDDLGFYLWKTYNWEKDFNIHFKTIESPSVDSMLVNGIKWKSREILMKNETQSYTFNILEDQVGHMKISDFNSDEKEIKGFYTQSFQSLKNNNSSHLIIDFRGHSGGADSYGEHLAKYFATKPFRKLSKAYWKITPEFKEAFDRKFVPKSIRWFKPIYLVNEYSSIFYGAKPNEMVEVNYEMINPLPLKERFIGNVYLITDHNTFSAGSIFAEMFKFCNMGEIIGQPTGNLYSFNGFALANFALPNSKLTYHISSVYNLANNKEEGMKSVEPDIIIDIEKDPLEYIIENLLDDKK
ncbi:MAG: S41 family peptidase [Muriicola sp.]